MFTLRKSAERGHTKTEWLDSYHSFSFGDYDDPHHRGFGVLRVINEDKIIGGAGFGTHPHQDMEIITYVLAGKIAHKDSLGTEAIITAGEVQRMSAGSGITHSEYNASAEQPAHFLQIWLLPQQKNLPPSYEQKNFSVLRRAGELTVLASPDGSQGSLTIHQDARIFGLTLEPQQQSHYKIAAERMVWIQVVTGTIAMNNIVMHQGDGMAIRNETSLVCSGLATSEILIFDLAASL